MVPEYYRCSAPAQEGVLGNFGQKVLAAERELEHNYLSSASDQLKSQIQATVDQLQRELEALVSELSAVELKQAELLQLRLESMRVTLF